MNNNPLLSICIPNYNNAEYLQRCLESAINLNYINREIIFIDDNSMDDSFNIALKYSNDIQIYKNDRNLGQAKNTNKAVDLSKGKYVVILHSDDELLSNFADKLIPLLEDNINAVMAVGERKESYEIGKVESISPFYNIECIVPGEMQAKVFMMTSFLPCQVIFRKDIFVESGWVNERHIVNLDGLLWFQLSLFGDLIYIQDEVCIYRIHENNTTSKYNKTINHMMEYYVTLSEMFKLAKGRKYLENNFNIAEKKVATLTLRYCMDVIRNKDFDLAKQYLRLAKVFDINIEENDLYIKLENFLFNTNSKSLEEFYSEIKQNSKRNFSYDPPCGYKEIRSNT